MSDNSSLHFDREQAAGQTAHRQRIEKLASRLPGPIRRFIHWLVQPQSAWLRIPLGLLLIAAGLLGFLPILGFWMIPLGALLLAEDIPLVRRLTTRAFEAVQRWRDRRRAG
jgi:hypothetical protein